MIREVVLDFETASFVDLTESGAARYSEDASTEILCLNFQVNRTGPIYSWRPTYQDEDYRETVAHRILADLVVDPDVIFIAHSAGFEKAIWRNIMVPVYGFAPIPGRRWHDTMAVAAMKAMPLDLDLLSRVLGLDVTKDMEGSSFTKKLSRPNRRGELDRSKPSLERVYDYCSVDIRSQTAVHARLGWLPPMERDIWLLDQRINERGVRLDLGYIRAAKSVVDRASEPLGHEFHRITGIPKFTQVQKLREWCAAEGVIVPDLQKETLARILNVDIDGDLEDDDDPFSYRPTLPDHVRRALYIRQLVGSASIKKLDRMQSCVSLDGRARGLLQYHGAGPGRWTGRLLQPQNFPRGTLKVDGEAPDPELLVNAIMTGDPDVVEMLFGPPVEAVVSGLRHTIVADQGRVLLSGDYAGIQARVVLALAGQWDKLGLMAAGADVYIDMACEIFKMERPVGKEAISRWKHEHMRERQSGKNSVLGLGFQMGWWKFQLKYAQAEAEAFCRRVVETYRKEWAPEVPKLWAALERAAVETVWTGRPHEAYGLEYRLEDGWLTATTPSGSKIWYYNPKPTRKAMPWSTEEEPDIRAAWTYQVKKQGRWITVDAYGGLLTENYVMRIETDIMAEAMFRLEREGMPLVLTVHDEALTEPLIARADEAMMKQVMADSRLARQLKIPLQIDTWAGDRYKK